MKNVMARLMGALILTMIIALPVCLFGKLVFHDVWIIWKGLAIVLGCIAAFIALVVLISIGCDLAEGNKWNQGL